MRLALLLAAGCSASSASAPLERVELPFREGRRVDRLLILIHGDGDTPRSFETNGFLSELAERAIPMDCVAVLAHPRYFEAHNFAEHLHDDLVFPKRQEGYQKIYVLGTARGADAAISFARRYAGEPDALILIAPTLGPDLLVDEINAQGGLDQWRPKPPLDEAELAWQWLQGYAVDAHRPPMELLWGERDPSAVQLTTAEEVLPPQQVHRIAGGRDWKTWRALWAELLDRDPFGWIPKPEGSEGARPVEE